MHPVEPPGGPTDIPPLPGTFGAVDSTEVDGDEGAGEGGVSGVDGNPGGNLVDQPAEQVSYPDQDPDQVAEEPERSRVKTFQEAMADAHDMLIRATGNYSAIWDQLTDGFSRTVSFVLPHPDAGSDGRAWSGPVWRVIIDAENRIGAAWDGYNDPEGFAAALFAANRKRIQLVAASKAQAEQQVNLG